jgi:hypothetical protein
MYPYYNLKPLVDQLREEALQEAQERHLAKRVRAARKQRSEQSRVGVAWASVLSLLHGAVSSE